MSSLARVLDDLGCEVSGSDVEETFYSEDSLKERNIKIFNFSKKNINKNYIYIISGTYNLNNNEEVEEIINKGYEYYYYSQFIEKFFKGIKIGVCGTHGKTTTVSMLSHLLKDEGVVCLSGDGWGYGNKNYKYVVIEACEYKDTFLNYSYDYLIVNNIDYDHVDYFSSIDDVFDSFQKVANKSKCLIINNDDEYARKIVHSNKYSFGYLGNTLLISKIHEYSNGYIIDTASKEKEYKYKVPLKGIHNIYNLMGAITLLNILGLEKNMGEKLQTYTLPKRRMTEYIYNSNLIIDDYAHHPKEIKAFISTITNLYRKKYNKIIVVFQPHTYSRTLMLKDEFERLFDEVDEVYYLNTYTSREKYDEKKEHEVEEIFKKYTKIGENEIKKFGEYQNSVICFVGAGIISSKNMTKNNEKIMKTY